MNTSATSVASPDHAAFDSSIAETLLHVIDAYDLMRDADISWLAELSDWLPDFTTNENRFLALLLLAKRSEQIHERAIDLLVAERQADPSLQDLIDYLEADEDDAADEPNPLPLSSPNDFLSPTIAEA